MARHGSSLEERYRFVRRLGQGGAGRVDLVEDRARDDLRIALKTLDTSRSGSTSLKHEFLALAALRHPNLVAVLDFHDAESPAFTMEYIDGINVVDHLVASPSDCIELAAEALRAIGFLHDVGILHRDLKPDNLLVRERRQNNARLVVLDFGLAVESGAGARELGGTLPYLAPELLQGAQPSRRTDLFALGAVLHQALHGAPPVRVDGRDPAEVLSRLRAGEYDPVQSTSPNDGYATWIRRLIAPDPGDRPATAGDALALLGAATGVTVPSETEATRAARLLSGDPPGRDRELEAIHDALVDDTLRVAVVVGGHGMGKTRILESSGRFAVSNGWAVTSVAADIQAVIDHSRLRQPTLFLVDDLDRAPVGVRALVDRIARESQSSELKAIVAVSNPQSDRVIAELMRDAALSPRIARIDVSPLSEDGIAAAAERADGRQRLNQDRIDWLLQQSGGVPLVVERLLIGGAWEQGANTRAQSVSEVVRERIERLDRGQAAVLSALAVCGGRIVSDRIHALLDSPEDSTRDSVDSLVRSGLVQQQSGVLVLPSRLIQDQQVRGMRIADRRRIAMRALESGAVEDEAQVTSLHALAGNKDAARVRALELADAAAVRHQIDERAWWLRFAAVLFERDDPERARLRLDAARELRALGESARPLSLIASILRSSDDATVTAEAHRLRARLLVVAGRNRECLAEAELAEKWAEAAGRSDIGAAVAVERAFALTHSGRAEEADRLLESSIPSMTDPDSQLEAHAWLVSIRSTRGWDGIDQHVSLAEGCLPHVLAPIVRANYLIIRANHERRHGRYAPAAESCARALEVACEHRLRRPEVLARSILASVAIADGRFDDAIRFGRDASLAALHYGFPGDYLTSVVTAESALVSIGRSGEAVQNLERLLDLDWFDGSHEGGRLVSLNLAEALTAVRPVDSARVRAILDSAVLESSANVTIRAGRALVGVELAAADPSVDGEAAWAEFSALLEADGIPFGEILIRGFLARARRLITDGDASEALALLEQALEALATAPMPALAARVYALRAAAHEAIGDRAALQAAIAAGAARLEEAAGRIGDPELRADFLAQPCFALLRRRGRETSPGEERLVALYDMIGRLNSESDPDRVLESMLDMALRVVGAERGMILLRGHGGLDFDVRLARNLEHETIRDVETFSRNVVLRAGSGQPVLAVDTGNDERVREWRSVSLYGIRSVLCVPLRSRGEIIGAVYLDSRGAAAVFDDEDLRFLEAFADHAALALENARRVRRLEDENRRLQVAAESRWRLDDIVGRSAVMQRLYDLVPKYAATDLPVLIAGDSGTGKELFARALHRNGARRDRPFLTENCAAISETLLESELFGHVRGAFTGAERDRAGLFEQASGGTLFLDEVGDMSPSMQARLLRVLQEGEIRRVGDDTRIDVDVRVIAATNRDLATEVEAGRFREDLMYRLQVLVLTLPPVRERLGDVPLLVGELLKRISAARGDEAPPRVASEVMDLLERYPWPGNVRELENTLQRLALLAEDDAITTATIESDRGLRQALLPHGPSAPPVLSLERSERERIRQALDATSGNRARAAKLLGISRATIFRKIKQYELS